MPPVPLPVPQFTDEFIDAYVRCTADELPLPDCALTLAVLEVMGGKLRESRAPVGLNEAGGWRPAGAGVLPDAVLNVHGTRWEGVAVAGARRLAPYYDSTACTCCPQPARGPLPPPPLPCRSAVGGAGRVGRRRGPRDGQGVCAAAALRAGPAVHLHGAVCQPAGRGGRCVLLLLLLLLLLWWWWWGSIP